MPALREILLDDAEFFPEGDAAALAFALERLIEDPDLARRLGASARERSAHYTYRARARKIVEVVASLQD
jgi:glycosyltransferase involved in cell wall biosynthesis